jgi:SPP1 family holin
VKVSQETIIRTILLAVALVNLVLNATGKNTLPFTEDEISEAVSVVFMIITSIIAWWKNNSFTPNAIKADTYLDELNNESEGE